jgi:hypothetical protein
MLSRDYRFVVCFIQPVFWIGVFSGVDLTYLKSLI